MVVSEEASVVPTAPAVAVVVARIGFDFCFRFSIVLPPPALLPELEDTGNFLPSISANNLRNSSISAIDIHRE